MELSESQQLFEWGRCQSCMMVSEGWDPTDSTSGICPNCGESGFGLEWPPEPARLLLRRAFAPAAACEPADASPEDAQDDATGMSAEAEMLERRRDGRDLYDQNLAEERAVSAFLVTTALDVMLEWVFKAAVESFPSDSLEVAQLVEPRHQASLSTEKRLDLLREVAGIRLRDIAEQQDEPRFPGWWDGLAAARDRFLHDASMLAFDDITEEGLLDAARMGVKVLGALNNALW